VRCALGDVAEQHLEGVEAIIHSAAYVEAWGPWQTYWDLNVHATEQLLSVARKAGVKRFVHIGTEACLFHGQHMRGIDETYPYALRSPYPYSRTKAYAEMAVLNANEPGVFETVSVRPRFIWGPGDQTLLPELKKMVAAGSFMWIGGGAAKTSTAYIDNVVEGIRLALEKGRGGEAYFITDDEVTTMREIIEGMAKADGFALPEKSVPAWAVGALAFVLEKMARLAKSEKGPMITRFAADIMARDCTINIDKAKRELGYKPVVTIAEGLKRMEESKK
jgi:nucleoside-diphosphate-sugar epimerase